MCRAAPRALGLRRASASATLCAKAFTPDTLWVLSPHPGPRWVRLYSKPPELFCAPGTLGGREMMEKLPRARHSCAQAFPTSASQRTCFSCLGGVSL